MTIRSIKDRILEFFGKSDSKWDWEHFQSTMNFPVSPDLIQWIIGQEHAMEETKLCIDEWIGKLKWLNEKQWWKSFENPMGNKPQRKEMLPAGPFMLLLGDAGTGKSLLGRAMQNYMTELYKKNGIILHDVVAWKNPRIPSEPKISIHATPMGRKIITTENTKSQKKTWFSRWGLKLFMGFMVSVGAILFGLGIYTTWDYMSIGVPFNTALTANVTPIVAGGTLMFSGIFIGIIGRMLGNLGNQQGIGGASTSQGPKLLIDNSSEQAPFLDATGHTSAQLFGDITWDPYQSGGLGTPEHQRVNAGDVHRAHLGIFFIDEIKNLTGPEAITLLTVLEDGQMPITHRGHHGETGAMMVSTEPIPAMFFLIAAGNLDSLPMIHPALLDRIQGYGKMVYMANDMPNTIENRRKYVQFISQEVKRFHLLPLSRDACMAIIEEASRRSGKNDTLTCKFRPMIGTIKTASILAKNEGTPIVERKHVDEALSKHCKSIALQVMEKHIENQIIYNVMIDSNEEPKIGQIHGLAVSTINSEGSDLVGMVLTVRASCLQKRGAKKAGYFTVTGVQTKDSSYIQHSIAKIRHIIIQLYGIDVEQDCFTHVDFAQIHGVEGPSAGITMTLALISVLTQRKIRQDIAVTGEVNIGDINNKIIVTPIGGAHEKILAAQRMGFKKVCIPMRNYEKNIDPSNYTIEVIGCKTIDDYIRECFTDEKRQNTKS